MPGNSQSVSAVIHFGPFDADLQTQELRKHGVRLRLPGQSFEILKMLLEHPGNLVSREELQKALWPSDTWNESVVSCSEDASHHQGYESRQVLHKKSSRPSVCLKILVVDWGS